MTFVGGSKYVIAGELKSWYLLPWEVLFHIKFVSFRVSSSSSSSYSSSSLSLQPLLKALPCCNSEWGQICCSSNSRRTPFHERRYQVVAVDSLWSARRGGTCFRAKIAVTAITRAMHVYQLTSGFVSHVKTLYHLRRYVALWPCMKGMEG